MAITITTHTKCRELAQRVSDGIEVTLFWGPSSGEVLVKVVDHSSAHAFELSVPSQCALDAFHHPYVYAARKGLEYDSLLPEAA